LLVLYVYLSREYTPRHVINLRSQLVCVLYLGVTRKREREREREESTPLHFVILAPDATPLLWFQVS
jgi:hypothetical protein